MSDPDWERNIERRLQRLEATAQLPSGYFGQKKIREELAKLGERMNQLTERSSQHMQFIWYVHNRIKKLAEE